MFIRIILTNTVNWGFHFSSFIIAVIFLPLCNRIVLKRHIETEVFLSLFLWRWALNAALTWAGQLLVPVSCIPAEIGTVSDSTYTNDKENTQLLVDSVLLSCKNHKY